MVAASASHASRAVARACSSTSARRPRRSIRVMDIEIRVPTPEDLDGIFDVRAQAFAIKESDRARWTTLVDPAGMVTAFLGTTVVGSLNAIGLGQWFGGRS